MLSRIKSNVPRFYSSEIIIIKRSLYVKRESLSDVNVKVDTPITEVKAGDKGDNKVEVKAPKNDNPVIKPPKTDNPVIKPPKTDNPVIKPPNTDNPVIKPPKTDNPVIKPPKTDNPDIKPPKTDNPVIKPPKTDNPVIKLPKTDNPVINPSKTNNPIKSPEILIKPSKTDNPINPLKTDPVIPDNPVINPPQADNPDKNNPNENTGTPPIKSPEIVNPGPSPTKVPDENNQNVNTKVPDNNNPSTNVPNGSITNSEDANSIPPSSTPLTSTTPSNPDPLNGQPQKELNTLSLKSGDTSQNNNNNQNDQNAFDPTKTNDPLNNPLPNPSISSISGTSSTSTISPTIDTGGPVANPFDPRSPYHTTAMIGVIGMAIAILIAITVLIVLLRKTMFSKIYINASYQRANSLEENVTQRQYSMTEHSLPPRSPTSFNKDAEELKFPSPAVVRKSILSIDAQLTEVDINKDYNELARRSSLLIYYVKDFENTTENDEEMAEEESVICSSHDSPKQPDKIFTWEECMS